MNPVPSAYSCRLLRNLLLVGNRANNVEEAERVAAEQWTVERRKMHRLVLTASAKVVDVATGQISDVRLTDVGMGGCFLDTIFPFSVGTRVYVTLSRQVIQFQADGKVVYSQPQVGMGIAFDELNADQRLALMELVSTEA